MKKNKDILKEKLLKKSINNDTQKYFLLFLKIEKLLKEERYRWLINNENFINVSKKSPLYLDMPIFNNILNFSLWCFMIHLLIMPIYLKNGIALASDHYGLFTVLNGMIIHTIMSLRFKKLTMLSISLKFESSEMNKDFFEKLLDAIPEDRLQDKKDMVDILSKYSYGYNGVKQYMYLLANKILNSSETK